MTADLRGRPDDFYTRNNTESELRSLIDRSKLRAAFDLKSVDRF